MYNLDLGSASLVPATQVWEAFRASITYSVSPNLQPQTQLEETSTLSLSLSSQTSVAGPLIHQNKSIYFQT